MKGAGIVGGQYKPLTDEQVETIHGAALKILDEIGFTYEAGLEDTLDMLARAGAKVDREAARIFFPRELIEEQVALAPEEFTLHSRDGMDDITPGRDRVYMGTGGSTTHLVDLETGEDRPSTLADLHNIARLVEKLDNIHFFVRPCFPTDLDPADYDHNCLFAGFRGTRKHIMQGVNTLDGLYAGLKMAEMMCGDLEKYRAEPFWSTITCFAISPLKLCTTSTTIMQEACRNGVPVALSSAPMAGSTAPITLAGTLALVHAEELVGVTISQLTAPGARVLYGGIPGAANMGTMGYKGGAVECGMMNAAIHQMARYVKVPNYNSAGLSDAKISDAQAGWEKALTAVLAAMGGSNYVHHAAGMLESMAAVAFEQYVIDDEILGQCYRVLRGIEIDEDRLALEAIKAVGPGGNFMTSPHTMAHLRSEIETGNGVTDSRIRERWAADGSKDARQRAREMARAILAADEQPCLEAAVEAAIRREFNILLK